MTRISLIYCGFTILILFQTGSSVPGNNEVKVNDGGDGGGDGVVWAEGLGGNDGQLDELVDDMDVLGADDGDEEIEEEKKGMISLFRPKKKKKKKCRVADLQCRFGCDCALHPRFIKILKRLRRIHKKKKNNKNTNRANAKRVTSSNYNYNEICELHPELLGFFFITPDDHAFVCT